MKTFKDGHDRAWTISINVFAVKRCRALAGVDLYGLVDERFEGLGKLLGDPVSFVDVLYCLAKDEADRLGVTDEDFGRAMYGDAIERASDAFLAELVDFFPDPRVRTGLQKVLAAGRKVRDRMLETALIRIDEIDPVSEARRLIASSGRPPASSVSTPAHSPSGNSS